MLAMIVNDNAGNLTPGCALRFFASMLAPTRGRPCVLWMLTACVQAFPPAASRVESRHSSPVIPGGFMSSS
ncbi:hypothetical protein PSUM_18545 [Pseudomonas umsongensis]|uniref:Uncharacterized protein n=1 Tax=Pseudomonas umsongensis TaxID=198618 RepID=A0ABX4DTY1_9PSED|nr:hypothetical protein PSUM_18545 [Pseudomonas umsongensis]